MTIGTLTLYRGIAQGILPSDTISGFPQGLASIGVIPIPHSHISYSVAFFLPLAVIFGIVLHATPLGRAIFAIGANQEAAFYSGIRVKRIKFWLFVLSGMVCGFAGVLWTLRFASARYDSGIGIELFVVTAVLLGGVSIFGGRGTIVGVVLAVAVLGCLQTAMTADLDSGTGPEHRRRRSSARERHHSEQRRHLPARARAATQRRSTSPRRRGITGGGP